jgi:hypothetical protein
MRLRSPQLRLSRLRNGIYRYGTLAPCGVPDWRLWRRWWRWRIVNLVADLLMVCPLIVPNRTDAQAASLAHTALCTIFGSAGARYPMDAGILHATKPIRFAKVLWRRFYGPGSKVTRSSMVAAFSYEAGHRVRCLAERQSHLRPDAAVRIPHGKIFPRPRHASGRPLALSKLATAATGAVNHWRRGLRLAGVDGQIASSRRGSLRGRERV